MASNNDKDSGQGGSNRGQFDSDTTREAGKKSHSGSGSTGQGGNQGRNNESGSTRGGSSEQHAKAGSQSHKNK